jgi:hypothetical protein
LKPRRPPQAGTAILDALKELKVQQDAVASDVEELQKKCCSIM